MPLHLFQNYLEKTTQIIEINVVRINDRVPQGSLFGPFLFLIYINDLNGIINFSNIHNFAGMIQILYASNSLKDIKTERLTTI